MLACNTIQICEAFLFAGPAKSMKLQFMCN